MAVNADSLVIDILANVDKANRDVTGFERNYKTSMSAIEQSAAKAETSIARSHTGIANAADRSRTANLILQSAVRKSTDQFAAGAPLVTIFAEHIETLAEVAQLSGGKFAALGAFLGGPWGIALTSAAAIAATLAGRLLEGSDAADTHAHAAKSLEQAINDLAAAQKKANQTEEEGIQLAVRQAAALYLQEAAARATTVAELNLARAQLQRARGQPDGEGGINFGVAAGAGIDRQISALELQIASQSKAIDTARQNFDRAKASRAEFFAAGDAKASTAEVQRHERAISALRAEYLKGGESEEAYRAKLADEDRAHDAAGNSAGRHSRALKKVAGDAGDAAKALRDYAEALKDDYAHRSSLDDQYGLGSRPIGSSDVTGTISEINRGRDNAENAAYRTQQDHIRSLASLYETAFTRGAKGIGDALKQELLHAIAQALAEKTIGAAGAGGLFGKILGFGASLIGGSSLGGTGGSGITFNDYGHTGLPGFATGGSFPVDGNGGVDRNVLSVNGVPRAMVSASERINVTPPGMMAMGRMAAPRSSGMVLNQTINIDASGSVNPAGYADHIRSHVRQETLAIVDSAGRAHRQGLPAQIKRYNDLGTTMK